jgi:4-amino-4-deoxy-L-arabinose transferase
MFNSLHAIIQEIDATSRFLFFMSFVFLAVSALLFNTKKKLSLVLLFASALCISVFFVMLDPFLNLWDEQFHALVAKNLAKHPLEPRLFLESKIPQDYTNWTNNEIWLHKPPLALWQMALFIKLFGANYFAVRLPSALLHAMLVFPIFGIGKIIWNEKIGFYGAVIFSFLLYPLELVSGYHTADHVDVSFLFYITYSLFFWLKYLDKSQMKWILLMGLFAGLAVLTKWLVGLLIYSGALTTISITKELRNSKQLWISIFLSLFVTLLVVVPWHIYAYLNFPKEYLFEQHLNTLHFTSVVEEHSGNVFYYWDNLSFIYGSAELISYLVLFSVLLLWKTTKDKRHIVFLYTIIFLPYLFFSLAKTKMPSFLVILSPLLILSCCAMAVFISDVFYQWNRKTANIIKIIGTPLLMFLALLVVNPKKISSTHFQDNIESRKKNLTRTEFIQSQRFNVHDKHVVYLNDAEALPYENLQWMFYHEKVTAYSININSSVPKIKGYKHYLLENKRLVVIDDK